AGHWRPGACPRSCGPRGSRQLYRQQHLYGARATVAGKQLCRGATDTADASVVSAALVTTQGTNHQQAVVRVHSRQMFYSDGERKGSFKGSVIAEDPNGVIHSDQAEF